MKNRKLLACFANHLQEGNPFDQEFSEKHNLNSHEYRALCSNVSLIIEYYLKLTTKPNRNFIKNLLKLPQRHLRKCIK